MTALRSNPLRCWGFTIIIIIEAFLGILSEQSVSMEISDVLTAFYFVKCCWFGCTNKQVAIVPSSASQSPPQHLTKWEPGIEYTVSHHDSPPPHDAIISIRRWLKFVIDFRRNP